jgi:microcystin-dependent protein
MPSHSHDIDDPGHDHGISVISDEYRFALVDGNNTHDGSTNEDMDEEINLYFNGRITDGLSIEQNTTDITILEKGGNQPHPILDPYLSLHFIIKVK